MMEIILDIINVIENFIQSEHFDISIFQNLYLALLTILIPISLYILQEKDFSFEWEKIAIIDKIIKFKELIFYTIIFFLSLLVITINIWIFIVAYFAITLSIYKVIQIIIYSLKWIYNIYNNFKINPTIDINNSDNFRSKIRKKYVMSLEYHTKLDFWNMTWSKDILDSKFEEFLLDNFFNDLEKLYKIKALTLYEEYLKTFTNNFIYKLNLSLDKTDYLYKINFNWQLYLRKTIKHHKDSYIFINDNIDQPIFHPFIQSVYKNLSIDSVNEFFNIIKTDSSIFNNTFRYNELFNMIFEDIVEKKYDIYLHSENIIIPTNKNVFQTSMFDSFKKYIRRHYILPFMWYGGYMKDTNTSEILKNLLKIGNIIFNNDLFIKHKLFFKQDINLHQIILYDLILILIIIEWGEIDNKFLILKDLKKNEYIISPQFTYNNTSGLSKKEISTYTKHLFTNFNIINDNFTKAMQNLKNSNDKEQQKIYNRLEGYLD